MTDIIDPETEADNTSLLDEFTSNISNDATASPNSNTSLDLSKKSSTSSSNQIEYIV